MNRLSPGGSTGGPRLAGKGVRRNLRRQMHTTAELLRLRRRVVVVDVENAVGGANIGRDQILWTRRVLGELVGLRGSDHVIAASSHIGAVEVGVNWPSARRLVRSGPDGADLMLVDVLSRERIAHRFAEMVLVSGDGIFADVVAELACRGVGTTVVAHPGGLSRRLRLVAGSVLYLPARTPTALVAA
jgi:hypothetical protein